MTGSNPSAVPSSSSLLPPETLCTPEALLHRLLHPHEWRYFHRLTMTWEIKRSGKEGSTFDLVSVKVRVWWHLSNESYLHFLKFAYFPLLCQAAFRHDHGKVRFFYLKAQVWTVIPTQANSNHVTKSKLAPVGEKIGSSCAAKGLNIAPLQSFEQALPLWTAGSRGTTFE